MVSMPKKVITTFQATLIAVAFTLISTNIKITPYLGFAVAFSVLCWLPGSFIFRLLKIKDMGIWESLPVKYLLSCTVLVLTGMPAFLFALNIKTYIFINLAITAILYFVSFFVLEPEYAVLCHKKNVFRIAAVVLCGITVLTVFMFKPDITADVLISSAEIRGLAEDAVIRTNTAYSGLNNFPGYNYNIHDLILGSITVLGKMDAMQVILIFPAVMSILIFISAFLFTRSITGSTSASYLSVIILAILPGSMEFMHCFRTSFFHLIVTGFVIIPTGYSFLVRYLKDGALSHLLISAITALTAAAIHPFGFISYVSGLLFFMLWFALKPRQNRQILKKMSVIVLLCCLAASPHIALQLKDFELNNVTEAGFSPWRTISLSKNLFIINPEVIFAPHYHVKPPFYPRYAIVLIYLAGLAVLLYVYREDWAIYLAALCFTPLLIVLNPLIYPLAGKIMSFQLLRRFTQIPPLHIVAGILIWLAIRKRSPFVKTTTAFLLCFLFVLTLYPAFTSEAKNRNWNFELSEYNLNFRKNPYLPEIMNNPETKMDIVKILRQYDSSGVVACDYDMGLFVVAFTSHKLVSVHPQYVSLAVKDETERKKALNSILNSADKNETIKAISKYEVDFIVLDIKLQGETGKFAEQPNIYEEIYSNNDENMKLFAVTHQERDK